MQKKILVIDDDRVNVALLRFTLTQRHYDVRVAYDGVEGINKVKSDRPDLIILDIHMPNMDGYHFTQELKSLRLPEALPIIVVTANPAMEDVFKLEGIEEFFVKPVNINDLLEKVKLCIGLSDEG